MGKELDPAELAGSPVAKIAGLRPVTEWLGGMHQLQRRNLALVAAACLPEGAKFTLRVDLDDPRRNVENPGQGHVVHLHYVSVDVISDAVLQYFTRYVRWLFAEDWRVTLSHATPV